MGTSRNGQDIQKENMAPSITSREDSHQEPPPQPPTIVLVFSGTTEAEEGSRSQSTSSF